MIFRSELPDQHIPAVDVASYIFSEGKKSAGEKKFMNEYAVFDQSTRESLTIHELENSCMDLASGFQNTLNIQVDNTVLIFSTNSLQYTQTIFSSLLIGAIVTLANPTSTSKELAFQIKDSAAKYVFTKSELLPIVLDAISISGAHIPTQNIVLLDTEPENSQPLQNNISGGVVGIKSLPSKAPYKRFTINSLESAKRKTAFLPYSSGTTGFPKGVVLSHYNIVANTIQISVPSKINGWLSATRSNRPKFLAVLPYYHIYGLVIITCVGLANAVGIVSLPKFELEAYLNTIQEHRITLAHMVPPMIIRLVNDPIADKFDLSSIEYIMTAAAPLSQEIELKLCAKYDVKVAEIYGTTETSPAVTVSNNGSRLITSKKPHISNGKLTCNVIAKVISTETGLTLSHNQIGELCFKGPNIMGGGYLNNKEATMNTIDSDNFLHTGDIGYFDSDSNLYVIDRLKELIKYKGFQVAPAELESLLLSNDLVDDVAVVGSYNHSMATEVPKAFIVLKKSASHSPNQYLENQIVNWVKSRVANHKQLRGGVEFISSIPKTLSGKILRRTLRDIENSKSIKSKL
ncbi:4-coumarate-CoA ligase-like 7 [Smittium culicis]|uniref:4-coumarate-CoA ligase-like 7 n=1 Tax=Smittium culicis TaxID=133412 RepID=A0A1R1X4Z4_9FUNG|nr:4-coumarate-CoA ligase-like 7 [Smittium culicis]